jgi:hypothetical protein
MKIQTVTLGTGPGGFVKARTTARGFILSGRGDEIEFAIEVDEQDYSQLSVSRKNIRYLKGCRLRNIKSNSRASFHIVQEIC